jgi:hypothetical protein
MLVPLAQVKIVAIVTEVGTGELRTWRPFVLGKPAARHISAQIPIIVRVFADRESERIAGGNRRPRNSGRLGLFGNGPLLRIHPINPAQIARAHP